MLATPFSLKAVPRGPGSAYSGEGALARGGRRRGATGGREARSPSAPRTQRTGRRLPAPATCGVDPDSRHPRTTAVYMDNSCLLDLLIRCFAMTEPEDLNFTAFTDLCRLCSLKSGPRLHIFDKESEQRQILFKLRTCLPTMVSGYSVTTLFSVHILLISENIKQMKKFVVNKNKT